MKIKKNIKIEESSVTINETTWWFGTNIDKRHIMDCIRALYREIENQNNNER